MKKIEIHGVEYTEIINIERTINSNLDVVIFYVYGYRIDWAKNLIVDYEVIKALSEIHITEENE